MVQISTVVGGRLSSVEGSVAGANRIAEAITGISSGGGGFSDGGGGADVERDRQHLAASGKFVAEGKARAAANANAAEASSLLQTADDALVTIRAKLDQLTVLAEAAEQTNLSITDRARMDLEFQTLKSEIDTIATDTAFNNVKLLQGGAGVGGAFEVSFKVGTGNNSHDDIIISIAPASVSDLSAGLEAGGITSMVGASTAQTNIAVARDVLDTIRGGIAGDMERFSIASRNNSVIRRETNATSDGLTTPAVVIDLAQLVARRTAQDGGYDLADRTVDQLRQLLIKLGSQDATSSSQIEQTAGKTGPNNSGSEASAKPNSSTVTGDKDAA